MWLEILCCFVVYILFRLFFKDDVLDIETSDFDAITSVAARLEKLYGGKAHVGLWIPDADTGTRQSIDIVLVTKGEAVVISVKNLEGLVTINADGDWVCEGSHKKELHSDPVVETKKQASVLESYLEQRGIGLPDGFLSCKVIIPNPKCCIIPSSHFPQEVLAYDHWTLLKPEQKSMLPGWIKGAFSGGKKEMQESMQQKLNFILSTAPMWDRLELTNNKFVLGEFLEFKGKQEDVQALRKIKRSKVGQVIIQKTSMLGFAPSTLQVLFSSRNYRSEGASSSDWKEAVVRSKTEVLFQPSNSKKVRKYKLSSIISMSLSA